MYSSIILRFSSFPPVSNILNCLSSPFSDFISIVYDSSIVGSCSKGHILFICRKIKEVLPEVELPKRTIVKNKSPYNLYYVND